MRWPVGLTAAGLLKVNTIEALVKRDYPYTRVEPLRHRIGGAYVREAGELSDEQAISKMCGGVALVYDATAEQGVNHFLSDYAWEHRIPYIAVDGTIGGWGGRVCRIAPGTTEGCWICYQLAFADGSDELSELDCLTLPKIARSRGARSPEPVMLIMFPGPAWNVAAWCGRLSRVFLWRSELQLQRLLIQPFSERSA